LFCNGGRLAQRRTETLLSKRGRQSSSKQYNSNRLLGSTPKLKTTQAVNSNDDLIWIPESQQQHSNSTSNSILTSLLTRAKQDISHVADSYSPFSFNKKSSSKLVSASPEWKRLQNHAAEVIQHTHLRDLLKDEQRSNEFYAEHDGVYFDVGQSVIMRNRKPMPHHFCLTDFLKYYFFLFFVCLSQYTRQRVTIETMKLLTQLAQRQHIQQRIKDMMNGEHINFTEDRPVLHTALRASPTQTILVKDEHGVRINAIKEVHDVLFQIQQFTQGVRNGTIRGYTGKRLRNFVSVGIGGSYLGPSFLHECLKTDPEGVTSSLGYRCV
jgi:glucose-6-phosphate isomerase